jgi:hypothetical protein
MYDKPNRTIELSATIVPEPLPRDVNPTYTEGPVGVFVYSGGGIETSTRDPRAHRYGATQIIGRGAPDRRALGPGGPTGYSGRMTAARHSPFLRCTTVVRLLVRSECGAH